MKHFLITTAVFFTITAQTAFAEGCDHGFAPSTPDHIALMEAIKLREDANYLRAQAALRALDRQAPQNFCVLYELGRVAINLEEYDAAIESLSVAAEIATPEDHSKQAIHNILGYTYLKTKQYDPAISNFETQQANPTFLTLPDATKTKVYNNTGFAYLTTRQFEKAQKNFEKAMRLGSKLAKSNLEVVQSMLAVQRAGNKDIPGIYGVALFSTRDEKAAKTARLRMAERLAVAPSKLHLFRRDSGLITATYGSNISYAKAEEILAEIKAQGLNGANIVATSYWGEVQAK